MDASLNGLRIFVGIAGPLVLVSYVVGIMRADSPEALWGGVDGALRKATIPLMFVAAVGFLVAAYLLLWKWGDVTLAGLHWPGRGADGQGMDRVLVAYAIYLIPSALWLESTLLYLGHPSGWTQALVIGVLTSVSVGLLLLGLLAYGAIQDGVEGAGWLMVAVVMMAVQSTINDNIVWVARFPWMK